MKFAIGLALGSIAALALPAAAAPQQFDLVCQAQTTTTSEHIKPIASIETARFSVDLAQKVWWRHQQGASPRPKPIADAKGDALKLRNDSGPQGDNRVEVDLKSGAYSALTRVHTGITPDIMSTAKGSCTLAPLTPGIL